MDAVLRSTFQRFNQNLKRFTSISTSEAPLSRRMDNNLKVKLDVKDEKSEKRVYVCCFQPQAYIFGSFPLEHIYSCFPPWSPMKDYLLDCLPSWPKTLIRMKAEPEKLKDVRKVTSDKMGSDISCVNLGSKVYLFGGMFLHADVHRCFSDATHVYDVLDGKLDSSFVDTMGSPKPNPHVVLLDGKIYVMAGPNMHHFYPDPTFEAYSPLTNSWEKLSSPPFLNESSFQDTAYFDGRFGYVVIDKKIHVITTKSSFVYDVEGDVWERTLLFDVIHESWIRDRMWSTEYAHFGFHEQAFVFDGDVLIGIVKADGRKHIVAYKMVGAKVVQYQALGKKEGLVIPRDATTLRIAETGDGYFCLIYTVPLDCADYWCNCDCHEDHSYNESKIFIQPFRVSKKRPSSKIKNGSEY